MKKFKRAFFFWLEQLHISRKERIALTTLLVLVLITASLNAFLRQKLNYDQEQYDAIMQEFEARSAAIEKRKREEALKYTPQPEVLAATPDPELSEPVNINTASAEELQRLDGIGATYAQRIIDYRKEHGPFRSVEELMNVKGIGKKTVEKLAPFVKL